MKAKTAKPILYPWQRRWVQDQARLKIAVKATQIGLSFAEAYDDVVDCLERPRNLWIILSRSERQALEFARKAKEHCRAIGAVAKLLENESFEGTEIKQHVVEFPNGSRIIAVTSNPDTARGFTGNVVLDEFAFHKDSKAVFTAAYGRATLGFKLRVISTPFGESGKFYELAKDCDLVGGRPPGRTHPTWSGHWADIRLAIAEGLRKVNGEPVDLEELRAGCSDEDIWQQEYCCRFISDLTSYITWEQILGCESVDAWLAPPEGWQPAGALYLGADIGRKRDLTVFWLLEKIGDVCWTRAVIRLRRASFAEQRAVADRLLSGGQLRRLCQDASGLGMQLAEELRREFGSRVEPISFTMQVKEDLAVGAKRAFEEKLVRIPEDRDIRAAVHAVRRLATAAGHFRFDAERTEQGHADEFWALALALHAATGARAAIGCQNPETVSAGPRASLWASARPAGPTAASGGYTQRCPGCNQVVSAFRYDDDGELVKAADCRRCGAALPPLAVPLEPAQPVGYERRLFGGLR